ncbi:hypothetical protein JBKA6_0879 [Ichthyobacterium seriolicida]|uniref:Uncharacterized protein n=1 Tax=Ichthyobacterium seriolicida TaxID=242600 RepID=A0A1J1E4C0_9FLAO|nr:hypothetical protein JBKA6_0879 [Ichthyobacterium seriolicida]
MWGNSESKIPKEIKSLKLEFSKKILELNTYESIIPIT